MLTISLGFTDAEVKEYYEKCKVRGKIKLCNRLSSSKFSKNFIITENDFIAIHSSFAGNW